MLAGPYIASSKSHETLQQPQEHAPNKRIAQSFFAKACVLTSLLPASLLTTQCHFFCGVYAMYSIRPVTAWLYFSQASLHLKIHLLSSRPFAQEQSESPKGRLMQRLYWSCMQSEMYVSMFCCANASSPITGFHDMSNKALSELANELRIKSSGLEDMQFPHAFPAPPVGMATEDRPIVQNELTSWMYYLSETSLRRICNEVVWTLYDRHTTFWVEHITSVQAHAERLEQKLETWYVTCAEECSWTD